MTIHFTEEEREWTVREPFNWHIKQGCPKEIEESLKEKLGLLYRNADNNRFRESFWVDRKNKKDDK